MEGKEEENITCGYPQKMGRAWKLFFFFLRKKPKREINLLIPTKEDCGVDTFVFDHPT